MLENDNEYKRLDVDEEGKRLDGDMGKYLDAAWETLGKDVSLKQAFGRLLTQIDGRTGVLAGDGPEDARPRCRLYRLFLEREL